MASGTHRRLASIPRRPSNDSFNSSNIHLEAVPPRSVESGELNSPYSAASSIPGYSKTTSISSKYSLHADPQTWGANLNPRFAEPDDALHNPLVRNGKLVDEGAQWSWSYRGIMNLGCLLILSLAFLLLFLGYPVATYSKRSSTTQLGVNASGQVPEMNGKFALIDPDTPADARTKMSWRDNKEWTLIFSDEFNVDGRTFYPGEDPYWEAVDLHYWQTNNMEWYDPAALTTKDGALRITLSQKETHDLHYEGGMMSTWNKFCFTDGLVEANVQLPGANNVVGLWPAVWTMGNLGRAGFGASLEGMWPYTYDACDVGTAPNQTIGGKPVAAMTHGWDDANYRLSFLPGQRLSRCTCPGESHPGPIHKSDKTYVGRSAPEIDIIEAQVAGDPPVGEVSQSGQFAPFNDNYSWNNATYAIIFDDTVSELNSYKGGSTQQAASVVSKTGQKCYQLNEDCYAIYGIEYKSGFDDAYIEWINDGKAAWILQGEGLGPDSAVEISTRPIPMEPLYLLVNLGMSTNFGTPDFDHLVFPAVMSIDYIRVYQDPAKINIGCDPEDFPTMEYINTYIEAYTNANLTTWVGDYKQPFPKNSLVDGCD
ncbi:glycoside hydrolase family 16 protein [Cylindrobasidium torrendii FP15055 ss-10]|uniref:Glycoside hydrolase family 16 protein n=1 Tax=Cylindrobasidium torrendii FP15055 ss-10 TaxID=1314674 RepID=A0A0D7B5V4_9AGAR|nr:glycoside hydrolase family 16 protein [Cylindrobasidium torrendii FP15055 ss-10]